jgi:hypothetical protein
MLLVSKFKTQVFLTGSHFFVKDNLIGNTILEGPSMDGLCPINLQCCSINKPRSCVAFLGVSTSFDTWHARLGHASSPIVSRVLSSNNLQMLSSANKSALCEFCQYRKSKQLLFAQSSRITTSPLGLVHSDMWPSPSVSLGGCHYHVVFIDDFSHYCWLYPLCQNSDVFLSFVKFKSLVENQLSS